MSGIAESIDFGMLTSALARRGYSGLPGQHTHHSIAGLFFSLPGILSDWLLRSD
jgi:hypothetical protein